MMMLVLGDEKTPNPKPVTINKVIISQSGVVSTRKNMPVNPTTMSNIPEVANLNGESRSDNLPEKNATTACIAA
jgi:hypothetical protein